MTESKPETVSRVLGWRNSLESGHEDRKADGDLKKGYFLVESSEQKQYWVLAEYAKSAFPQLVIQFYQTILVFEDETL